MTARDSGIRWRAWCWAIVANGLGWLSIVAPVFAGAEDVVGEWRTPAAVQVQIKPCGEGMCGRIVRLPDESVYDLQNPEPRLRARPVLGIQIFNSIRRSGVDGWKGYLYVPESGYTYVSRLRSLNRGQIQVSTCGPLGFFCSSEIWTRTR